MQKTFKKIWKASSKQHEGNLSVKPPNQTEWIFGLHATLAALINPHRICYRLLLHPKAKKSFEIWFSNQDSKFTQNIPRAEIKNYEYFNQTISPGSVHQGIAALFQILPSQGLETILKKIFHKKTAQIVVLDQVTDPQNVGAILRSAYAFGVSALVIQTRNSPKNSGALAKAASGALEHLPLIRVTNLARAIGYIKESGFWAIGFDPNAEEIITKINFGMKTVLVLGSEGTGLRRLIAKSCDQLTRIDISKNVNSLNISNAAAIGIYEATRK